MLKVLSFTALVRILIVLTAAITALLYYIIQYFTSAWPIYRIVIVTNFIAPILVACLLWLPATRALWALLRKLNPTFFPDLNGTWEGKIEPIRAGRQAPAEPMALRATIRQSLLLIQIDFHAEDFQSVTLAATPTVEEGQQLLYYIYRAEPKNPKHHSYMGTTTMKIHVRLSDSRPQLVLSGQYFTSRQTRGRVELVQVGTDPYADIAYY